MQRPVETWPDTVPASAPAFAPSPTCQQFGAAARNGPVVERRVLILMASRGEGKTSTAIVAIVDLAHRLREEAPATLPLVVAVVRDSHVNLERTTMETVREFARRGLPIEWKDAGRQAITEDSGRPLIHWHFFGMDRPSDADKLQGFTCGVLWLEEVAPAADLSAGIPAETFGLGVTSLRQRGVPKRVLVTMNPPDDDAWILRVEELLDDIGLDNCRVKRWDIPPNEKARHFRARAAAEADQQTAQAWSMAADEFEAYRRWCDAALTAVGRHDLAARLVGGQIGEVRVGEPVVPTFVRSLHVVDRLDVFANFPIVRLWDGGGSPSCCIVHPLGDDGRAGLNVLASHTSLNTPMEQHIRDWVLPMMSTLGLLPSVASGRDSYTMSGPRPRRPFIFRDIGDPSMQWEGATVKSENTSGQVIQEMLGGVLEPGPIEWDARREALTTGFYRPGGGDRARFILIDRRYNKDHISALAGRWRYPKDMASGRITMTVEASKRASGPRWSGMPDALAYGLAVMFPAAEWIRRAVRRPVPPAPRPRSWVGA